MAEVFKTDISDRLEAGRILALLQAVWPEAELSIDLEDCDKVLRVVAPAPATEAVKKLLSGQGYLCEEL